MSTRRFLMSTVAILAFIIVVDWGVHGKLLMSYYESTAYLWRPVNEMADLAWLGWVINLTVAGLYVGLFNMFNSIKNTLSLGITLGLLLAMIKFISFTYMPLSLTVCVIWALAQLVQASGSAVIYTMINK